MSFLQHGLHPRLIVEIPPNGLADAVLEFVRGRPAKFALNLRGVNRITPVVARTVCHEGNQLARMPAEFRFEFVNQIANQFHNPQVRPFVVAADVVGLAEFALLQHRPERLGVVAHVKPVAHVHAVAINRHRLAREDALDDHRNQFFGKLKRPVIVRAIRDDRRQAVGVVICAHQHVARRLARGIRRIRRVRRRLGEIARRAERAKNLIRGDMMKTEFRFPLSAFRFPLFPTAAARLQQIERAIDVRGDEIARPGDGPVHVRFRREVHDVRDGVLLDHPQRFGLVAQIHLLKNVFRMARDILQIFQTPGVSETVQIDEPGDALRRQ